MVKYTRPYDTHTQKLSSFLRSTIKFRIFQSQERERGKTQRKSFIRRVFGARRVTANRNIWERWGWGEMLYITGKITEARVKDSL